MRATVKISVETSTPSAATKAETSTAPLGLVAWDTLDVGDLAALVLHEQGRASAVLDHLRTVRKAVNGLAVLDGLYQVRHLRLPR